MFNDISFFFFLSNIALGDPIHCPLLWIMTPEIPFLFFLMCFFVDYLSSISTSLTFFFSAFVLHVILVSKNHIEMCQLMLCSTTTMFFFKQIQIRASMPRLPVPVKWYFDCVYERIHVIRLLICHNFKFIQFQFSEYKLLCIRMYFPAAVLKMSILFIYQYFLSEMHGESKEISKFISQFFYRS